MKQSTLWIWVVVIVLILIGGIWWYYSSENSALQNETGTTTSTNSQTTSNNQIAGMKTTLGGIFDDPGSYQCDYDQISSSSRSTNVVYVADGKLRGEFRTQTATTSTLSMAVYDGSNLYVWTEGKATGKVSQPKTIKDLPSAIPEDITSGKILGSGFNNVSWNCHAWSKDTTKLSKPTYVTFQ